MKEKFEDLRSDLILLEKLREFKVDILDNLILE
jgi:hypothetical protein